jgi:hypothetical protein
VTVDGHKRRPPGLFIFRHGPDSLREAGPVVLDAGRQVSS